MQTAKLFNNGGSQAVRLPKEFRFSGDDVYIKKYQGIVMLLPKESPWSSLVDSLDRSFRGFHGREESARSAAEGDSVIDFLLRTDNGPLLGREPHSPVDARLQRLLHGGGHRVKQRRHLPRHLRGGRPGGLNRRPAQIAQYFHKSSGTSYFISSRSVRCQRAKTPSLGRVRTFADPV